MKHFPLTHSGNDDSTANRVRVLALSQSIPEVRVGSFAQFATAAIAAIAVGIGFAGSAIAQPEPVNRSAPEVDTSVTRDYEPAIVYIHDPETHELTPRSVLVGSEEPVEGAVDQIMQSYEGQDVGIRGYEVSVDSAENEAAINFNIENPRGGNALQSLSSANQYSLFEAIRETLLTQPMYEIDEVNFLANGSQVDI
ncbi:hypothetical protein IQ268_04735 [Oculatella sp. LEGE 06141]|uniref:hypothetical protein n=1 Tax=Oculatella sp. LEGE 06141 TaxID=1828648 RepID=UPI0018801930|nr:hypothetical protein [Oculatella sp. LEGE 06141]MBE9177889.1 hypothetical protein [Oculatella sp. LEGE 06141]